MELTSITPSPSALKALSHPVRLRLLGLLRSDGPATASSLALRLGLNSGATSYHLRQLHQHGFIEEDPSLGTGRDRWWRAAHQSTTWQTEGDDPAVREAADAFGQAVAVVHTEELQRATEELPLLPEAWRPATTVSDWALRLTPSRAHELMRTLQELVGGWEENDADDDAGAAEYVVQLHTFVRPGTLDPDRVVDPDETGRLVETEAGEP